MNERNQLAIFIFYCLITKNMQQLAGCIIYMLHFQNATAELKRKWDWFLPFLMFLKMLFCSFHLSGSWKEHSEFLKPVTGIIVCILDVDTVVNKSIPGDNLLFTI